MNTDLIKASFQKVRDPGQFVTDFYDFLFMHGGAEVIDMFPAEMVPQRDRLARALVRIVGDVGDLGQLVPYLQQLGRDHRKYGITPAHYDLVGFSLLRALARHTGPHWTGDAEAAWTEAYAVIATTMIGAAAADTGPASWDAEVTGRELRGTSTAILHVRVAGTPMAYKAGQSVSVHYPDVMRGVRRFYSPADPPGCLPDLTFHVKAVDDGMLSRVLAFHPRPGDRLVLGPAVGTLTLDRVSRPDIALIAGSTGLAPLMAIVQELATRREPPDVHLFHGAATPGELYLSPELDKLAAEHDWLTVTTAAVDPRAPGYQGQQGTVVDVATRHDLRHRDVLVCGGNAMVRAALAGLRSQGVPQDQIHIERFGWE